jgi:hypothetical protein
MRSCRPDAERPCGRLRRKLVLGRPEEHPATRTELGFVADHADRDTTDIWNLSAAQAKRIAAAGLLLILGIGLTCRRQHRKRQSGSQHQAELDIPGPGRRHESPHIVDGEVLVRGLGLARDWQDNSGSTSGDINANGRFTTSGFVDADAVIVEQLLAFGG